MKKLLLIFALSLTVFACSSDSSDGNSCPTPESLDVNSLTNTTASLYWYTDIQSSLYQVEYGTFGFAQGSGTILTVPENSVHVEDLMGNTQYTYYVRVFCNESGEYSNWSTPYNFVTLNNNPYCEDPESFNVRLYNDSVSHNHIDLSWSNGDFDGSEIQYGIEGFTLGTGSTTQLTTTYPSYARISNLNADTSYDFYVRNTCGNNGFSSWIGPVTHSTLEEPFNENCIDPVNFTSTGSGTNASGSKYFDFTWDHDSSQNSWEIAIVEAGDPFSDNSISATSFDSVRLSYGGVTSGQAYDFYLRANCGGTDGFSGWVGPVTVTAQ